MGGIGKHIVRIASVAGIAAASMLVGGAPAHAAPAYTALGDSYSSGVGTSTYYSDGTNCQRSPYAYPVIDAQRLGAMLTFAACSGASVADMQNGQLGNLKSSTGYVTASAGSDTGFSTVISSCARPWPYAGSSKLKGGDTEYVYWASGTAHLLLQLIRGRTHGPVFLSARRPGPALIGCRYLPATGRARLGYDRARILLDQYTRTPTSPGWDLHEVRHYAATHPGDRNAGLQLIMAKGSTNYSTPLGPTQLIPRSTAYRCFIAGSYGRPPPGNRRRSTRLSGFVSGRIPFQRTRWVARKVSPR